MLFRICTLGLVAVLALTSLTGCEDGESIEDLPPDVIIGDDSANLSLWIAGGSIGAVDELLVTITGVQLKQFDGDVVAIALDRPLTVDLLGFDALVRRRQILDDHSLPVGRYDWLRLMFDETRLFVGIDGLQHSLVLADSARQNRLIDLDIVVEDGDDLELTIHLDPRQSLLDLGADQFAFRPRLRIVNSFEAGTLLGSIDNALIEDERCANGPLNDVGNAVYVFEGSDAAFQDIRGDLGDPLATTTVVPNFNTGLQEFRVDFLPPGEHTVVFTCDSAIDEPDFTDFDVGFSDPFEVGIEAQRDAFLEID